MLLSVLAVKTLSECSCVWRVLLFNWFASYHSGMSHLKMNNCARLYSVIISQDSNAESRCCLCYVLHPHIWQFFYVLGADSLAYLSVDGLVQAVRYRIAEKNSSKVGHCTACLTGNYPEKLEW